MAIKTRPINGLVAATDLEWAEYFRPHVSSGFLWGHLGQAALSAPGGMLINVASYRAIVDTVWNQSDATVQLTVPANSSGSTRIDRVVDRLTRSTGICAPAISQGAPGAGVPPALSATDSIFDIPIGVVTVINGETDIQSSDIVTGRFWAGPGGAGTWTDFTPGYITVTGFTVTPQTSADNHARYQVVGSTCHVDFSQSLQIGGVNASSFGLQVKLPVPPKWTRGLKCAAVCQGDRNASGLSVFQSPDYYVDIRKQDGSLLINNTNWWEFSGSYEIAQ